MRQIKDALESPETKKEDVITVFLALQRQCYCLSNNISNLVKNWPNPLHTTHAAQLNVGTSSETNN